MASRIAPIKGPLENWTEHFSNSNFEKCPKETSIKNFQFWGRWVCPYIPATPLWQWGFRQCLPFSWTLLRGNNCQNSIAVVVDIFGPYQEWTESLCIWWNFELALSFLSLNADFCIHFYWLSQLRQPSQRKMIQSSALQNLFIYASLKPSILRWLNTILFEFLLHAKLSSDR